MTSMTDGQTSSQQMPCYVARPKMTLSMLFTQSRVNYRHVNVKHAVQTGVLRSATCLWKTPRPVTQADAWQATYNDSRDKRRRSAAMLMNSANKSQRVQYDALKIPLNNSLSWVFLTIHHAFALIIWGVKLNSSTNTSHRRRKASRTFWLPFWFFPLNGFHGCSYVCMLINVK